MKGALVLLVVHLFASSSWVLANPLITSSNYETTIGPVRAPIFREAVDSQEDDELDISSEPTLSEILCECVHDNLSTQDLLDASAEIELDSGDKQFVEKKKNKEKKEKKLGKLDIKKLPDDECERYELLAALNLAQAKMVATIGPYRIGTSRADKPAFRLGDSGRPQEPLGANINNYAPDNFDDLDVMRLFEMHRSVRELLATGGAGGGERRLPVAELRALNREVRESFKKAMLDFAPAVEDEDASPPPSSSAELDVDDVLGGDLEECAICRESLASEPSARLPCGHVYHKSCLASWARIQDTPVNTCPRCREIFRLPYRMVRNPSNQNLGNS